MHREGPDQDGRDTHFPLPAPGLPLLPSLSLGLPIRKHGQDLGKGEVRARGHPSGPCGRRAGVPAQTQEGTLAGADLWPQAVSSHCPLPHDPQMYLVRGPAQLPGSQERHLNWLHFWGHGAKGQNQPAWEREGFSLQQVAKTPGTFPRAASPQKRSWGVLG